MPERKPWWKSRKTWGTILSCLIIGVGHREGWPTEMTNAMAYALMGGVTVEGLVDAASVWKRNQ